ncbi:MAG: alpha-galactosidase, partial [Candidatus Hydrogenedentes bacterium]|nr:alpha-galactosidase [Candidatus Hydrogenedentota bacterium]
PTIEQGDVLSLGSVAGYNPTAQRPFIAGFLSAISSFPQVRIERAGKDSESIGLFRAECVYDPPIEVQPGGRLESELLYIAVSESDPFVGLERYGDAVSHMSGGKSSKRVVPHSWDSWSTKYRTDINEERMLSTLDFVDKNLKRYGWTHFAMDDGWQVSLGDWQANPQKFPHGMKWFADQVHARGMTAGIWVAPFKVDPKSELAQQHPDWLVAPNAVGKELVGEETRILDVTAPGASDYVKALMTTITKEWGYDAVKADYTYYLLFMDTWRAARMTRAEVLRTGMRALRDGIGQDKSLMSFPPGVLAGPYLDSLRIGDDTAPVWRKAEGKWAWGCVDALTNAARRYYMGSYTWATDQDCAFFAHGDTRKRWDMLEQPPLTMNQSIAWFTGAALTGGVVEVGDDFSGMTAPELSVLRRLLPVPARPARPVDLFDGGSPRIWSLPVHSPVGDWEIAGVFNWDTDGERKVTLDFAQLGMSPSSVYTVFDFWADKYYGTAQGKLNVAVGPGSVRLLGLKPYEGHPMFLSTNRHFTQGATDCTALSWDDTGKRLAGAFNGVADTDYELKVLVPDEYTMKTVAVSAGSAQTKQDGKVLTIAFHCAAAGPVNWGVDF